MDIHPPHEPVRSVKDFLYHMLTIMLGILIALSLEGLVDWSRHRRPVHETGDFLTREISTNQARLKNAEARQNRSKPPAAALDLSFGLFPLSSPNWNEAQSSGALALMDPVDVQRYERIYVVREYFLNMQDNTLAKWLELRKWAPFMSGGKGLNGLDDREVDEFKEEAAAALVYLQSEGSIANTLSDEYGNARIKRP